MLGTPLHVQMAGTDLGFDGRDLLTATDESHCHLLAFLGDLAESPTIAIERGLLVAQRLPPGDDHVDVLRVQFYSAANAFREFGCRQGGPAPQERIVDQLPALRVVQNRSSH